MYFLRLLSITLHGTNLQNRLGTARKRHVNHTIIFQAFVRPGVFATTQAERPKSIVSKYSKVKYASICIARFTAKPRMRSDMGHTVLPANYTMPAFTPQPQNITAFWLVLILPSHGG